MTSLPEMTNDIPVHVAWETGSDGELTGKVVFVVNDLHRYYYANFDPGVMEANLENAGYTWRQIEPLIAEMQRQYEALIAEMRWQLEMLAPMAAPTT